MSTITKEQLRERARQKVKSLELAVTQTAFADSRAELEEELELARIALASLEAEPVCVIDQSNLDYLKSGSDADVWPASRTEMGDVLLYRAAPPAPVAVPDDSAITQHFDTIALETAREIMCDVSRRHEFLGGEVQLLSRIQCRIDDACRAAMLQGAENAETPTTMQTAPALDSSPKIAGSPSGNSPVIPDCWCRTCRPITLRDMRFVVCPECGNKRCPHANDHRNACTGSNEPGQEGSAYPATPQQEVK